MSPFFSLVPGLPPLLRGQRRSAGASALIILTLALALGANAAVLSVADALLIRAVPYPAPAQLVAVQSAFPRMKLSGMNLSGPEALEFQRLTTTFTASGPFAFTGLVVQGSTEAELATGVQISAGAFEALGVRPAAGRSFSRDELNPGGPAVALLGHGLWRRAFGGDPSVIGRVVQLGGVAREIVGIMPDGLSLLNRPIDLWLPLASDPATIGPRADHNYNVVARLAEGHSLAAARGDVARAMEIWRDETGEMHVPTAQLHPIELQPFIQATTGMNREPIGALLAAVGFVLLIACANISNLLVARAEGRRGDVAVQLALGATRGRLLRESMLEGMLFAGMGCLAGAAIAYGLIGVIEAAWPAAAVADLRIDGRVLGAAGSLAVLTGALIGVAPILRLDTARSADWLKNGARGAVGGPRRVRLQTALIVLQVAVAVLLSTSAGLMVRSLLAVTSIESGLRPEGVLRAQVSLPAGGYGEDAQVWSFYDRVLERLRQQPGVESAAVMSGLPPQRRANNSSFLLDGNKLMDHSAIHQVDFIQHIAPDYLQTMGLVLRDGRPLMESDHERAAPAALVNETLAKRFWPNTSAIGRRLEAAGGIGSVFTVVGVVADAKQNGIQAPVGSELYVLHRQARLLMSGFMPRTMNIVVRSNADLARLPGAIRSAVREVDPAAAVSGILPMQTVIERTVAQPRLLAWMFSAFAALALVVAGVGVYAVASYAVNSRSAEFGVRMALGARPIDVIRLVMTAGLPTVLAGIATGCGASLVAARLVRRLLYGVEPLDPISLAAAAAIIGGTALLATVLPACRAARVDPLTALRD
jgi:putative ABC transport system permease protein